MFTTEQEQDLEALRAETQDPSYLRTGMSARFLVPVTFQVPMGELAENWALALLFRLRAMRTETIAKGDRFNAQGLETKAVCQLPYGDALIHSQFIQPYRFQIVRNNHRAGTRPEHITPDLVTPNP